jgi:hypothetical protein
MSPITCPPFTWVQPRQPTALPSPEVSIPYFKETRFDLADEGHARMVMKGGYGAGVTDAEGKIAEPLASLLAYWSLDPDHFTGRPDDTREALQEGKTSTRP